MGVEAPCARCVNVQRVVREANGEQIANGQRERRAPVDAAARAVRKTLEDHGMEGGAVLEERVELLSVRRVDQFVHVPQFLLIACDRVLLLIENVLRVHSSVVGCTVRMVAGQF